MHHDAGVCPAKPGYAAQCCSYRRNGGHNASHYPHLTDGRVAWRLGDPEPAEFYPPGCSSMDAGRSLALLDERQLRVIARREALKARLIPVWPGQAHGDGLPRTRTCSGRERER